jgi:hypothetical protein
MSNKVSHHNKPTNYILFIEFSTALISFVTVIIALIIELLNK